MSPLPFSHRALAKLAVQIYSDVRPDQLDAVYLFTETPDNEPPVLEAAADLLTNEGQRKTGPLLLLMGGEQECGGTREDAGGNLTTVFHGFTKTKKNLMQTMRKRLHDPMLDVEKSDAGPAQVVPWPFRCEPASNMTHTLNEAENLLANIRLWNQKSTLVDVAKEKQCAAEADHNERTPSDPASFSLCSSLWGRKDVTGAAWRRDALQRVASDLLGNEAERERPRIRKLGIIAPTIHLLRAFMTTASVLLTMRHDEVVVVNEAQEENFNSAEFDDVQIFAIPGAVTDWNGYVVHSQGIASGSRTDILDGEFARIERYYEKGDILPPELILDYLRNRTLL
eukprot:g40.t1